MKKHNKTISSEHPQALSDDSICNTIETYFFP